MQSVGTQLPSIVMQLLCERRLHEQSSLSEGWLREALVPPVDAREGIPRQVARLRRRTSGPWLEYPWEAPAVVRTPAESSRPRRRDRGAERRPGPHGGGGMMRSSSAPGASLAGTARFASSSQLGTPAAIHAR